MHGTFKRTFNNFPLKPSESIKAINAKSKKVTTELTPNGLKYKDWKGVKCYFLSRCYYFKIELH